MARSDTTKGTDHSRAAAWVTFALHASAAAVIGLVSAFVICSFIATPLASAAKDSQISFASAVASKPQSVLNSSANVPKREISFKMLNVTDAPPSESNRAKDEASAPVEQFKLIGTIPPTAAWIANDGETSLVMSGGKYNGYTLSAVSAQSADLTLGEDTYSLFLYYSANPPVRQAAAQPAKTDDAPKRADVQDAEFDGKDGTVSRELLNTLIMNPYEELGKLRLIPTSSGMMIESMRSSSILNQLGVKRGDEVTGINGISIKDMPSIMNALNSMMTGTRLDFDVVRNNKKGKLGYVVK